MFRTIKLLDIEENVGQVPGLKKNPRYWNKKELTELATSIEETPELMERRPLLVYAFKDKYVVLGGNMRYNALKQLGKEEAECYVFPKDTSISKLEEVIIKDNGSFGRWNMDDLANEWDIDKLQKIGIIGFEGLGEEDGFGDANVEIDCSGFEEKMTMKFTFTEDELEHVKKELSKIDSDYAKAILKLLDYEND